MTALKNCNLTEVYLLTSYTLGSIAKSTEDEKIRTPSRLKLIHYLNSIQIKVLGTLTMLDPIFNKGIGVYYTQNIEPSEKLVLEWVNL